MNTSKITSTEINTGQIMRIKVVIVDRVIMKNSYASPNITKSTVRTQTSQIKIRKNISPGVKLEIVTFYRQKKVMTQ